MGIVIGCTVAIGVAVLLFKYLPKYLKRRNDDDDEVDDDDDRDAQVIVNRPALVCCNTIVQQYFSPLMSE